MPRGEHFKRQWTEDPEGMRAKTQKALEKARLARLNNIVLMSDNQKARLKHLFDWCDEQDKIYEIRKAKGDFLPKRVPLWTNGPIKKRRRVKK